MQKEINLVPDVKEEMIKTIKLRNYILFACIMVMVVSASVALIFGLIMGGQKAVLGEKDSTLNMLSDKLNSYSELGEFLTIKNQVSSIDDLTNNKKVLSRTFDVLSAMIPAGADTITVSKLDVDLSEDAPVFSIDAQANAGKEPYIDYNVLDSFKKSMQYMRYDYGRYVDKKGENIPAYCMIEFGDDGATLNDPEKGLYAYWTINAEGCNPSSDVNSEEYAMENYNGADVVRIWRTPQYNEWYKQNEMEGQPYMSLDGEISGVEHFESACIKYVGNIGVGDSTPKWIDSNENCLLVPEGIEGIEVKDSSNGRDSGGELVLRFSADITLAPQVFRFANHHMLAIAPSGRRNVTDSYVQIQSMFGERAKDCDENDTACAAEVNKNGGK